MTLSFSSLSGGTSFTVITSTGGSKTATLSKTFPAGTYLIESMAGDTNLEVYLGASDGTQVGSATAGAKSVTASAAFLYVTTVNANTDDAVTFTLKSAATLATKTDAVWAPPTITDITPSGLPNVNDTTTITGTNFATNVDVKFRKSDDSTLVTPKSTVRGSATSIIATRPDSFTPGDAPYDVIVTNPSTNLSATSLNAITAGAVPVWVTSTNLNAAQVNVPFSQTIQATDSDGGSSITYAIVSGSFHAGLSFNTSTGAITGTPTGSASTDTIVISATDSGGNTVNRTFTQLVTSSISADYLVVAGGGGGGYDNGGGGGAGGLRSTMNNTGRNGTLESQISLSAGVSYTITVGAGGTGSSDTSANPTSGIDSSISGTGITTITSFGGGRGGRNNATQSNRDGASGGSGGGAWRYSVQNTGGSGTSGQGYDGGTSTSSSGTLGGSGGGGAGQAGASATPSNAGKGGDGVAVSITGSSVYYAGGGGGSAEGACVRGLGGLGGGGNGGQRSGQNGDNGGQNLGGGGGGVEYVNGSSSTIYGNGGSGVVILRTAVAASSTSGSPVYTNPSAGVHIYKFNNNGSITF